MGLTESNPIGYTTSSRPVTETNDRDLLLTVFEGEILAAYTDSSMFSNMVGQATIVSGDKAQILATGRLTAEYLKRGQPISSQDFQVAERFIRIDRPIGLGYDIYDFEEKLAHYNLRGPMAKAAGEAMVYKFEVDTLATIARASLVYINRGATGTTATDVLATYKAASVYVPNADAWTKTLLDTNRQPGIGHPGGTAIAIDYLTNTDRLARALLVYDAFMKANEIMDEKYNPKEGRFGVIPVRIWYDMLYARNSLGLQVFYHGDNNILGAPGSQTPVPNAIKIGDITVISTTMFQNADTSANLTAQWPEPKYALPWTKLVGLAWQREAVANIMKMAVKVETERSVKYQTDFVAYTMLGGHDVVRPECAVSIWDKAIQDTPGTSGPAAALDTFADQTLNLFITESSYEQATT